MQDASQGTLQAGALFHDRYRIVRPIKSGGMGTVYEVVDERTNGPRALKVMLASLLQNADQRSRFSQEARVTGGIDSEHVVRVFDAGVAGTTPFLVMELLRGEELQDVLERRRRLPPDEACSYLMQAARALEKTLGAGIVHRDIKPENLFVYRRDDGSTSLKILDFGIAKIATAEGGAKKTRALGTPLYMAPEQVKGDGTIGPRADLYALAHVAYTTLTGEPYWAADLGTDESLVPMLLKIVKGAEEPACARARRRTGTMLPPAFDGWFAKATAVDPSARFDGAIAQIEALSSLWTSPTKRSAFENEPTALPSGFLVPSLEMPTRPEGPREPSRQGPTDAAAAPPTVAMPSTAQPAPAPAAAWQRTAESPVTAAGPTVQSPVAPVQMRAAPLPPPNQSGRGFVLAIVAMVLVALVGGAITITLLLRGKAAGSSSRKADEVAEATAATASSPSKPSATGKTSPTATASARPPASADVIVECPVGKTCSRFSPSNPAKVDTAVVMKEASLEAAKLEPTAQLITFFIHGGIASGELDLTAPAAKATLTYGADSTAVQVDVTRDLLAAVKYPSMIRIVALPSDLCSFKQAWDTASGAGLPNDPAVKAFLMSQAITSKPVWSFNYGLGSITVDAVTCKIAPF